MELCSVQVTALRTVHGSPCDARRCLIIDFCPASPGKVQSKPHISQQSIHQGGGDICSSNSLFCLVWFYCYVPHQNQQFSYSEAYTKNLSNTNFQMVSGMKGVIHRVSFTEGKQSSNTVPSFQSTLYVARPSWDIPFAYTLPPSAAGQCFLRCPPIAVLLNSARKHTRATREVSPMTIGNVCWSIKLNSELLSHSF